MTNNKKLIYKDKSANIQHLPSILLTTKTRYRYVCPLIAWFIYTYTVNRDKKLTYIKILQHLSHFMGKFIQTVLKVKQI